MADTAGKALAIALIDKGAHIGAHILSGAVFEPHALNELIPHWQTLDVPIKTKVCTDKMAWLYSAKKALMLPSWAMPKNLHNQGNYIISLGQLCQWLGEYAEQIGVNVFSGFAAVDVLYNEDDSVCGVLLGEKGLTAQGEHKSNHEPSIELRAQFSLFAEGSHGHLGKQLIKKFHLNQNKDPQHYGLGIKEVWQIPGEQHQAGLVLHTLGWPLSESRSLGGGFLYHWGENLVSVGLITDLSYRNPHVSPFEEMQRHKTHPLIKKHLSKGQRIAYGARSITKGGVQSLPTMHFAGGLLIGDDAGTLNFAKVKGIHTAMKSAMVAAETVFATISQQKDLSRYTADFQQSWAYQELYQQRNVAPAQQRWGVFLGAAYGLLDMGFGGRLPWTLNNKKPDHTTLINVGVAKPICYPKPDGRLTFDRASSLSLAALYYTSNQPVHLRLADKEKPLIENLAKFDEPAQRYCPAGVYEVVDDESGKKRLQINAENCLHCKACDIKDPAQNITWVTPEGGSGPNYSKM